MTAQNDTLKQLEKRFGQYLWQREETTLHTIEMVSRGWESEIFRCVFDDDNGVLQQAALRLYSPGMSLNAVRAEFEGMRTLFSLDYPVPEVYWVCEDKTVFGRYFMWMEFVSGRSMWDEMHHVASSQQADLFAKLGHLMFDLHQLDPRLFNHLPTSREPMSDSRIFIRWEMEGWKKLIPPGEMGDVFAPLLLWLEEKLNSVNPDGAVIIHYDLHPENILIDSTGECHVIDWTGLRVSDPRVDVSWAALLMESQDQDWMREAVLGAYQSASGKMLGDLSFFDAFCCTRRIASLFISAHAGSESLGMLGDVGAQVERQLPSMRRVYTRFLTATDGFRVPAFESFLKL